MQKISKIISLLLTLCMMLSVALPLTVSAATVTFSDVDETHTYHQAITNLAVDGILNGFEDGSFQPDQPVTRAQFTKVLCYALGVGDMTYSDGQKVSFPDVVSDHWAIHNITTAYNSKIINGYDDGTFKPENSVLYEQAVKMAVCALGYPEDRAARYGGYPNGYLRIALDIQMLQGIVDAKIGQPLTRGGVAQLIDNMMDAELYFDESIGLGGESAGSLRDQATSSKKQVNGRIVAVYGTALYANETSNCNRKQIELELSDGTREFYGIENIEMQDTSLYLGRSVTVYYEEERGASYDEATNIIFQPNKNRTVTIDLDDIQGFSGKKLEYYDRKKGTVENISIAGNTCVISDGQTVGDSLANVLTAASGKNGSVTLVCSLDNIAADVAFVKTYTTVVVSSKDNKNYKIYAYNNSSTSYTLDETDRSKTITFTKDGKPATFSSISTGNVVSISTSQNGKMVDVQISSVVKKGTVSEVNSSGQVRLGTDATVYRLASGCIGSGIAVGAYATMYLDAFGKVARYTITSEKAYKFGYLAAAEGGSLLEPEVRLKVFSLSAMNATASPAYYSLKETVRIDGHSYTISEDSATIMSLLASKASQANMNPAINNTPAQNATYAQPIRFTTSGTNEIDSLLTVAADTGTLSTSLYMNYDYMTAAIECFADKTTLGKYSISSSVPILVIPTDRATGTYMTKSHTLFKKGTKYYVQFANINESTNQPQAIYVYGTQTGGANVTTPVIDENSIPMIVTEVIPEVNYKGSVRRSLKLQGTDGSTMQVYDDSRAGTSLISSIEDGDIIRVAVDDLYLVDAIERLVSANAVAAGTASGNIVVDGTNSGSTDRNAPFRAIWGKVYSAAQNTVVIVPSFSSFAENTQETYSYTETVKLYVIDTAATNAINRVQECTFGDITGQRQQADNASNLFIYTAEGNVTAMILIK